MTGENIELEKVFERCAEIFDLKKAGKKENPVFKYVVDFVDKIEDGEKKKRFLQYLISRAGVENNKAEFYGDKDKGYFFYKLQCELANIKVFLIY